MSTWLPSTRGTAGHDYTRVCEACGTAWRLPKQWATEKAPEERRVKVMQVATKFAIGRQRKLHSTHASTMQSSQERVLTNARCPSCGASAFTQYKPGEVPLGIVTTPRTQQGTSSSRAAKLAKLVQLRDSGALTDDEFAAEIDLL
jgi:hypothetical protein